MTDDLVRRIETTFSQGNPKITRMSPRGRGRIDVSGNTIFSTNDDLNEYDNVARRIYDALRADPQIMSVAQDFEEEFPRRSHRNTGDEGRIVFNLGVGYFLNQLSRINFILDYQENTRPAGTNQELQLPTTFTLRVNPLGGSGLNAKTLTGAFEGIVEEADLPAVAVRETRRILNDYGYSTFNEDQIPLARSMYNGAKAFIDLAAFVDPTIFERCSGELPIPSTALTSLREKVTDGAEVLFGYRSIDSDVLYFNRQGTLFRAEIGHVDSRHSYITKVNYDEFGQGYVSLGFWNVKLGGPIKSVDDYLRLMQQKIDELGTDSKNQEILNLMGVHLAGFAKAAERFGYTPAQQVAHQLAERAIRDPSIVDKLESKLIIYDNSRVSGKGR